MAYFTEDEFKCKCGCGMDITDSMKKQVINARHISGVPYTINSGARCKSHNAKVGGSPTSTHIDGDAVDIGYKSPLQLVKIVYGLIKAGFTRIGIHPKFVHVDKAKNKPDAIWEY